MSTKTHHPLSEYKIERAVEREINILDRLLMRGLIEQEDYDQEVKEINAWADAEYKYTRDNA